jgi:hypothetical protein
MNAAMEQLHFEARVVINPETFVRSLADHRPGANTYMPPARRHKRAPMCQSCIFGQHQFCHCRACVCDGEFRNAT